MGKKPNIKAQSTKTTRLTALIISMIMAVALVITGILCFGINKGKRIDNEVGVGDQSAVTTHNASALGGKTINLETQTRNGTVKNGDKINLPFCATLNSQPSAVTTPTNLATQIYSSHVTGGYWKQRQNGYAANSGMYTITLLPGKYTFELWGGQGGNTNAGSRTTNGGPSARNAVIAGTTYKAYGGMGAYAKGTLTLTAKTTIYIHVGGQGTSDLDNPYTTVRGGGYNGGGGVINDGNGGGGGGATDLRIATNSLSNRILVAAGGGGAAWGASNPGGAGGATSGEPGYFTSSITNGTAISSWWSDGGSTIGGGGTQTHGGYWLNPRNGGSTHSSINNEIRETAMTHGGNTYVDGLSTTGVITTTATEGAWGQGGNGAGSHWAGGAGGGGWFGGGGGYVHTGGGGSSFALTADNIYSNPNSLPSTVTYAYRTDRTYALGDAMLVAGTDSRLKSGGTLVNPGGTNFGSAGRLCANWAPGNYPTSYSGCGFNDNCGDGYARITVVEVNKNPIATTGVEITNAQKGVTVSHTYAPKNLAQDEDAANYSLTKNDVYFCNSKTDLNFATASAKLYLDANCTKTADDYVQYSFTNNQSFTITKFYRLPRKLTDGLTKDNELTLYTVIRDGFGTAKGSVTAASNSGSCVSSITVKFKTLTATSRTNTAGIEYIYTDSAQTQVYHYRFGMSTTGNPDEIANAGAVYSKTYSSGSKFAITVVEPMRINTYVEISAQDIIDKTENVKDLLKGYDKNYYQAYLVPDNPAGKNYSYILENPVTIYNKSVTNPGSGGASIQAYTSIKVRTDKSSLDWQNPSWDIYIVEKEAAPKVGTTYPYNREPVGITYNSATSIKAEINFIIDNTRPVLKDTGKISSTDFVNGVVDVSVGDSKTINVNSFFYDIDVGDNAMVNTTHKIDSVIIPTKEFVQVDKYGNIVSAVAKGGAASAASYYNVGSGNSLPNARGDAQTTADTGFKQNIAYNRDLATTDSMYASTYKTAEAFMRYSFSGLSITVEGLRTSYSQYSSTRAGSSVYTGGAIAATTGAVTSAAKSSVATNPGHFYLLVNIIDSSEPTDSGIWLPIAFTVGKADVSKNPLTTGSAAHSISYSDQTAMTVMPKAEGGKDDVFYFSPMGVNTLNATGESMPIGKYKAEDSDGKNTGALTNAGLQALAIDEDNFATDDALSSWSSRLNELVTLYFGDNAALGDSTLADTFAENVSKTITSTVADTEKFVKIEPLELFVPVSYFSVYNGNASDNPGRITTNYASGSAYLGDGVKQLNLTSADVETIVGIKYYKIYGLKLTLVSSTMNRWLYAKVPVVDSNQVSGSVKRVTIAIRVTNTSPTAAKNVASGTLSTTSSVEHVTKDVVVPTIRYSVPINSTFMITPYDLISDYDLNVQKGNAVQPKYGFTLNGLSGAFNSGLFTVGGAAGSGDIEVKSLFRNISVEDPDNVGSFIYPYRDNSSAVASVLASIRDNQTVSNLSAKADGAVMPDSTIYSGSAYTTLNADDVADNADNDYMVHNATVYNDRLYFERTSYATSINNGDAYLFAPYSAVGSPSFENEGKTALDTYVTYATGNAVKIGTETYNLDYVLIRTNNRTLQPLTLTLTVRDRFSGSAEGTTTKINVIIDIVNSAPTIANSGAVKLAVSTDTQIDGKQAVTEQEIEVGGLNGVMQDDNGDTLSYIQSFGVIVAHSIDLADVLTVDNFTSFTSDPKYNAYVEKYLYDGQGHLLSDFYVNATITSPTNLLVSAVCSTRNLEKGLYVYFFATDNRGGDSLGYKQIEVFDSKPVLNTTDDGFNTETWSIESTRSTDISRTRYIAGSDSAATILKKSIVDGGKNAASADVKLLATDPDSLHGAILSPRAIGASGGQYINLSTSVIADSIVYPLTGTSTLRSALNSAVPQVSFDIAGVNSPTGSASFPTPKTESLTSGTPNAVLLFTRNSSGTDVAKMPTGITASDFTAKLWFYNGAMLIDRAAVIDEIVNAATASTTTSAADFKAVWSKYFDENGRWIVRDWALSIQTNVAFSAGEALGMEFSIRDDALYGGDTAGLPTSYNVDRTKNVQAEKYVVSTYNNNEKEVGGKNENPFRAYFTVSDTGIRVKDEFAIYDNYYVVEDEANTKYLSTGDTFGGNTEAQLKAAYRYPAVIDIPAEKVDAVNYVDVNVPMSYFGTMATLANGASPNISYNPSYVGYNVIEDANINTPNVTTYNKGLLSDIADAISLSDGVTTWNGTGEIGNTLDKNPYLNISTFDATGSTTGNTAFDELFNKDDVTKKYSKPYFNDAFAIPASGGTGIYTLTDQTSELTEHNFGLTFSKKDVRTGARNLTLTIKLATSQGNKINITEKKDPETSAVLGYDFAKDTRTVSVSIKVENSKFDLTTAGNNNVLSYDNTAKTYYTDVLLSSSASQTFTLTRTGDSTTSGSKTIFYNDYDYSSDGPYRDYAYFMDESISPIKNWRSDATRPAAISGGKFVNTVDDADARAQNSMTAFYNANGNSADVLEYDATSNQQEKLLNYAPNGGKYTYSGYFGATTTNSGRSININANNKTTINLAALPKILEEETIMYNGSRITWNTSGGVYGGLTKEQVKAVYASRGLVATVNDTTDGSVYKVTAYYPLRVLIYDSCGVGVGEGAFVAMEFRISVTNSDPSLKNVGESAKDGNRTYNISLAILQSVQINLYDIVNDHDILEINTGRNRLLATQTQFTNSASGITRETGDYLVSPYTYMNSSLLTTQSDDSKDVSMWMSVVTEDPAHYATQVPALNYLNFTVFRRTTQVNSENGNVEFVNKFEFPITFRDSSNATTKTITFIVNVTNQTPYITTSETNVTMRVGDYFTVLTTYYDNFVGGMDYVTGNGLIANPAAAIADQITNANEGSAAFKQSATKSNWVGVGAGKRSNRASYDYSKMLSNATSTSGGERCVDFINDTTNGDFDDEANVNMGYIGLANDDTPWTLRISNYSNYKENYYATNNNDRIAVEGAAATEIGNVHDIGLTITARRSCERIPLEITIIDGEIDGKNPVQVKHTIYITVVSTGPTPREWNDVKTSADDTKKHDQDIIKEANLETVLDASADNTPIDGTYNMYLIPSVKSGNSEQVTISGKGEKTAFKSLTVNMTSVAKDPDGDTETQEMILYNNGMFADEYGTLAINNGEYISNNKLFKIKVDESKKSFTVTATGYSPNSAYETLTFYIADFGNNILRNALKITLNIYIAYSDLENTIVPAITDVTNYQAYLTGSQVVNVKSQDNYNAREADTTGAFTPSKYAVIALKGNTGTDGNTVSPVVDRDASAALVDQNYSIRLYALMKTENGSRVPLTYTELNTMFERGEKGNTFRLKDARNAGSYLIGGINRVGQRVTQVTGINPSLLAFVNSYAEFTFADDGASILFTPVTATINQKILLYAEVEKQMVSSRPSQRENAVLSAGSVFTLNVKNSAPRPSGTDTSINTLSFTGAVGDSVEFTIHDPDDPYGSMFRDSDKGDRVTVKGFDNELSNQDYKDALAEALKEYPALDWDAGEGNKPRAFDVEITSDNKLKITINRRVDKVVDGKYQDTVLIPLVFTGVDIKGDTCTTVVNLSIKNTPTVAKDEYNSYSNTTGVGYSLMRDSGNNYTLNARVLLGQSLTVNLEDFMDDPDYISAKADTDSFMFVDGEVNIDYSYLVDKTLDVFYYLNKQTDNKVRIATVTPVGKSTHRTGFMITPTASTRGYTGTVLVRVVDRSADADNYNNGILITVNITLMNSAPYVKDGMDTSTITLVGASNESSLKNDSKVTLSIGDYVADPNVETDIVGANSKYQPNTYLRIYSSRYMTYDTLYSNVDQNVMGGDSNDDDMTMGGSTNNSYVDSSSLFTFSISGDYNQEFTLEAKAGFYGSGSIEIIVVDGDPNVMIDTETVRFRINVVVVFNPDDIPDLNGVTTARGKSSVVSIESIIPSIKNTIKDQVDAVSQSAMTIEQKKAASESFSPASYYNLLSVEPSEGAADYVRVSHESGSTVWTLVATKVTGESKRINVKYALKSDYDEETDTYAQVYDNYFDVNVVENYKPELIYKEITFFRYTDAVENTTFMLNTNNTSVLRPEQILTDPEDDVIKITAVKSQKPSLVSASVENNGQILSITFNARGSAKLTLTVMDETEEAINLSIIVINNDLPEPSLWMRITSSFESNKVMWAIILGIVLLAIIILIIVIAVVNKRRREREQLEALLVSEMEIEEQMMKLAGAPMPTNYQNFGYLQSAPGQRPVDPGMLLSSGQSAPNQTPVGLGLPPSQQQAQQQPYNNQPQDDGNQPTNPYDVL